VPKGKSFLLFLFLFFFYFVVSLEFLRKRNHEASINKTTLNNVLGKDGFKNKKKIIKKFIPTF